MADDATSPQYKAYGQVSSKAAEKRQEERKQREQEVPEQMSRELAQLKRDQAATDKEIEALQRFQDEMAGDENIRVAGNRITWVGKTGAAAFGATSVAAVLIENGQVVSCNIAALSTPVPFPSS